MRYTPLANITREQFRDGSVRDLYITTAGNAIREPNIAEIRQNPIELGDEIVNFDARFITSQLDGHFTVIEHTAFAVGMPMRFIRNHDWQGGELILGTGEVVHDDLNKYAHLVGEMKDSASNDDVIRTAIANYNAEVRVGIIPEVSVGFRALEWMLSEEDENYKAKYGDDVIIITKADGIEVSTVFRGSVPDTQLLLYTKEQSRSQTTKALAYSRMKRSQRRLAHIKGDR